MAISRITTSGFELGRQSKKSSSVVDDTRDFKLRFEKVLAASATNVWSSAISSLARDDAPCEFPVSTAGVTAMGHQIC